MARFYSNENFPQPVVESLRRLGHDVLTILEAGKSDQAVPDSEVLAFAVREKRILLTLNRKHFMRLHTANNAHSGIVACTFDIDFARQAERIHEAVIRAEPCDGKLIRVNRPSG